MENSKNQKAIATQQKGSSVKTYIISIRGLRVIIDKDLAELYGVKTKRLNEQVKRNNERFPGDFVFQLTEAEKEEVVANCDHLKEKVARGFQDNEEELQAIRFAIQQLMSPIESSSKKPIGFGRKE